MLKYSIVILAIFHSMSFVSQGAYACNTEVVKADNSVETKLYGVLRNKVVYGPPSFGENPNSDRKEVVWYVILEKNVKFKYKYNQLLIEKNINEMQIYSDKKMVHDSLNKYLFRPVEVTGFVWSSTSEGDVTPVVMGVDSIGLRK